MDSPTLLADIGGTWARFALRGEGPRDLHQIERFECAAFPSLESALERYLALVGGPVLRGAVLALPGPTHLDTIPMANNPWTLSRPALEAFLKAPVTWLNDFVAQALASGTATRSELTCLGPVVEAEGVRVIVGPGTGLGMAVWLPGARVLPSEGGHIGFSPSTQHEIAVLNVLLNEYDRVSVERLVSGPGLVNLFRANAVLAGPDAAGADSATGSERRVDSAQQVHARALDGDPVALQAIEDFFGILAGFAGDMVLAFGATGGVYLSGDMIQKLRPFMNEARFRARFEAKGRMASFCKGVATALMDMDEPGLVGCAVEAETLYR